MLGNEQSANITRGVHTAEVQRVAGRNYAFLAVNTGTNHAARLIIVDLGDPSQKRRRPSGQCAGLAAANVEL